MRRDVAPNSSGLNPTLAASDLPTLNRTLERTGGVGVMRHDGALPPGVFRFQHQKRLFDDQIGCDRDGICDDCARGKKSDIFKSSIDEQDQNGDVEEVNAIA